MYSSSKPSEENPYSGIEASAAVPPQTERSEPTSHQTIDPRGIDIGDVRGPMVIFYGPREIGKTVATMRLLHYIRNHQECEYAFASGFRTDERSGDAKRQFREGMQNIRNIPPRTSNFNFLLLSITQRGRPLFNLLEAPGEHFFSEQNPGDLSYPMYLNQLFRSDEKKIFVLFLEDDLMGSNGLREQYSMKISNLINQEIQPRRDRLIILFNKIDQNPELFRGGRVNEQAIKNKVYGTPSYQKLIDTIRSNRTLREVLFVPFYSGNFVTEDRWNMSETFYPQMLWNAINRHLRKRWVF